MTESIGIEGFQHVQEKVAETIIAVEIVRALLRAAEADAAPNSGDDDPGVGAAERRAATGTRVSRSASRRSCASWARAG